MTRKRDCSPLTLNRRGFSQGTISIVGCSLILFPLCPNNRGAFSQSLRLKGLSNFNKSTLKLIVGHGLIHRFLQTRRKFLTSLGRYHRIIELLQNKHQRARFWIKILTIEFQTKSKTIFVVYCFVKCWICLTTPTNFLPNI